MSHGSAVLISYKRKKKAHKSREKECEEGKVDRQSVKEGQKGRKTWSECVRRRTRQIDQREIEGGINEERRVENKGRRVQQRNDSRCVIYKNKTG